MIIFASNQINDCLDVILQATSFPSNDNSGPPPTAIMIDALKDVALIKENTFHEKIVSILDIKKQNQIKIFLGGFKSSLTIASILFAFTLAGCNSIDATDNPNTPQLVSVSFRESVQNAKAICAAQE